MAKTKEEYAELGAMHARNEAEKAPFPRDATSWQAKAYWAAHDVAKQPVRRPIAVKINLRLPQPPVLPKHLADSMAASRKALKSLPSDVADQVLLAPDTRLWPRAAQEHVRLLMNSIMNEASVDRRVRLIRKLKALDHRHGPKAAAALATPMTSAAAPEGPVTLGDLLAGR